MSKRRLRKVFQVGCLVLAFSVFWGMFIGCDLNMQENENGGQVDSEESKTIFLYGEVHCNAEIQKKELELWKEYYDQGMRDLFIEWSYFDGMLLNLWMKEEDDAILNRLWESWQGTLAGDAITLDFYSEIKKNCPETVFHGTDVGFGYETNGEWYLDYLEKNGQKDSEEYKRTRKCMEQGKIFEEKGDWAYRENQMAKNLKEEYEKLDGAKIMGIYGSSHVDTEAMNAETWEVPSMAKQLKEAYGGRLYTEDLAVLKKEKMKVNGKEYTALYYGELDSFYLGEEYQSVAFWQLEHAYDDFKDMEVGPSVWNKGDSRATMAPERVYVLDLVMPDGTKERKVFRTDKKSFEKLGVAKEVILK